ncbi:MAG: DNA replication/repair protein RecF [Wenzhouxiangellaceae bacterium]|nr:DNA replication/repair protein RecF [Wenzhouxiangellaceae bacterium]
MPLKRLALQDFRNIESASLDLDAGLNWFFGVNGAGKTSVLEGVHVLARGRSFRSAAISPLIRQGAEALRVFVERTDPDHRLGVERESRSWRGRLDGRDVQRVSAFARILPLTVFEPATHMLVEGGPDLRRSFADWALFHVEHDYLDRWSRYARLLRQRNAGLKTGTDAATLEAIESSMASAAADLDQARGRWVETLSERVPSMQDELGVRLGRLRIAYRASGGPSAEAHAAEWRAARVRDREAGFTRSGPHRAEITIEIEGRRAAPRLSRGQQKLTALLLKLAQMESMAKGGVPPILLLDDPVSELDAAHLEGLLRWLVASDVQTLLTAVEAPKEVAAAMFHVEQGQVLPMV